MQRTGSIMVVDDEPTIGELIVEILTDEGYVAYSAPYGAALVTIARWSGFAHCIRASSSTSGNISPSSKL